jgi:hypothetical protein
MTGQTWLDVIISVTAAVLLSWLALIIALAIRRPKGNLLREALRVLPDLLRHRRGHSLSSSLIDVVIAKMIESDLAVSRSRDEDQQL